MRFRLIAAYFVRRCAWATVLFLACFSVPGLSATLAYQNFGQSAVGNQTDQTINIPAVTPGPAAISLQYSIDFSIGACTPNGNGCSLPVSFLPTKPGLRQDAVIVKDANGQVVEEVLLSGVALGPLPVFSPALATLRAQVTSSTGSSVAVHGIATEPDGKILMLTFNTISRFDPATNTLTTVLTAPLNASVPPYPSINGLATDGSGSIYYANVNSEIHRIDAVTQIDSVVAANANTFYLTVSASGTIFYTQGQQVFKVTPNTGTSVLVAGNGVKGFAGDNGPATQAEFANPNAVALDLAGNLYITDLQNGRVRKVGTSGTISTVAGTGTVGDFGDGRLAVNASLNSPSMLAVDAAGDIYVTTSGSISSSNSGSAMRRIDAATQLISTVAGSSSTGTASAQNPFLAVGFSATAQDVNPGLITLDGSGNLWIGTAIYTSGRTALFQVSPSPVPFKFPFAVLGQTQTQSISLLNAGTADLTSVSLRSAGQTAPFSSSTSCPSLLTAGTSCSISLSFTAGAETSPVATLSVLSNAPSSPEVVAISGTSGGAGLNTIQLTDVAVGASSQTLQTASFQFAGNAANLSAVLVYGNEFSLGALSCSGTGAVTCATPITFAPKYPGRRQDALRLLDSTGATVYQTFLSGNGQGPQWLPDSGTVGSIPIPSTGIVLSAIDAVGNLYAIAGSGQPTSQVYRFDQQSRQWALIAGQASGGIDTGDGGPATEATLYSANAVAVDAAGNLFVAEHFTVRRIDSHSGIITTVDQQEGDSIAIDQQGYIYIGIVTNGPRIRRLDPSTGAVTVIVGNNQSSISSGNGDGGPAISASFSQMRAIGFDNNGNLLISDYPAIRKIDLSSGIITTYTNGCPAYSIMTDAAGDLYLGCGQIIPPGPGTARALANTFFSAGFALRDAGGTFYASTGATLSPALPPISMSTLANGGSTTASTSLTNTGNTPLLIGPTTLSGTNAAEFSQANNCGQSLAPAQNCTLTVTFTPTQTGLQTAALNISSTNFSGLQTTISGTGGLASVNFYAPSTFVFRYVPISKAPGVQTIEIQNEGIYPYSILSASITGPNAPDFAVSSNCPAMLPRGNVCTLTLSFTPADIGVRTATLTVTDNATGSPRTVALTGSGVATTPGAFLLAQGSSVNFGLSILEMQTDGNLGLYQGSLLLWSTGTGGQNCGTNQCEAIFQSDGNLVVYNGSAVLWSSGTYGHPDSQLVFSNLAPRLQIVDSHNSILWSNVTGFQAGNLTLTQGMFANLGSSGTLVMQNDGNLVLYQGGGAIWNTGTYGQDCSANQCVAIFQSDGNLVVYNGPAVLWSSVTYGNSGAVLAFSATAPHVQIISVNDSILWTDVPAFQAGNLTLFRGAFVELGSSSLVMQTDGNLVLYRNGTALWNSGTYGQDCFTSQCQAIFQSDGNLVVYKGSTPLWNSATYGNPGAELIYSEAGAQLKIVSSDQRVLWSRS